MSNKSVLCTIARGQSFETAKAFCFQVLPAGDFRRITIKPNWVKHQSAAEFPIAALVTDARLIEAIIDACLEKYPGLERITVGDVPLQTCEFEKLLTQSGVNRLVQKYRTAQLPVRFCDWRRERFQTVKGFHQLRTLGDFGDPEGYRDVNLGDRSFLEPISGANEKFRVSDYDPGETTSSHVRGQHRYLIAGSALECDLFINVPKLKSHQKSGVTGALKNLVGINGNKAFLVHYKKGTPANGGDEFPSDIHPAIILQTRIREALQKRSRLLFKVVRPWWLLLRRLNGIQTEGLPQNLEKTFYIGGGSWYGNDTIWRMVYDLNKIICYAPPEGGALQTTPQRAYLSIMDGITAGEGNGPLQPLPVQLNVLIASPDPFLQDMVMARLMGFDWRKIPLLAHHRDFADTLWGNFDPEQTLFQLDGALVRGIDDLPVLRMFLAPPGWRGRIEIGAAERLAP